MMRGLKLSVMLFGISNLLFFLPKILITPMNLIAQSAAVPMSAACIDPVASGHTPSQIQVTMASTSASTCSGTIALTSPVHSQANPSATCYLGSGGDSGTFISYFTSPQMKLAGLQCQPTTQSTLDAYGDGVDSAINDISMQSSTDTLYNVSNKIDDNTSGVPAALFGTGGLLGASALVDGSANDGDGGTSGKNGEIMFGSGSFSSRMFVRLDFTTGGGSFSETLTYLFTGS